MSQSDPPLFTFQAPPGWDALKSTTSRRTTDGPILPVDLMSIIIQDLTKDRSLGTLASLQSTSKEMYNMATPALYRHIIVDQRQAVELFRLFESFPRSDNTIFLHPAPPDPSTHLINVHLAERLRFFFSNTQSLSLKTTRRSDHPDYEDTKEGLARYKEIQSGLVTFNGPTLWPNLEQCEWFVRPWQTQQDYEAAPKPEEDEVFLESIFTGLRPSLLIIQMPEFSPSFKHRYYDLSNCARHLRADHIQIFNYTMGMPGSVPRASRSMTVHFRRWSTAETDNWHMIDYAEVHCGCLTSPFAPLDQFVDVHELTLAGLQSPRAQFPVDQYLSLQAEILGSMSRTVVKKIMTLRLDNRNFDNLKITFQSHSSPEGEAAAVSRVFKQPGRP